MRVLALVALVTSLLAVGLCVQLGFWQLGRLREKRALNAVLQESERTPALDVAGEPPEGEQALVRPLRLTGRFDESHQFLLSGRIHDGEPGVEVVTPLRLQGSPTAVLVNRGWLPAADAATARPQDHPEPGDRTVRGVAEVMSRGAGGPAPRRLAGDGIALWSVRGFDADSIAGRLPYPIAGYVIREAPGPGLPRLPRRSARRLHDESVHVGYAIQWFLFAAIILGCSIAFAWSRVRRAGRSPLPEASP